MNKLRHALPWIAAGLLLVLVVAPTTGALSGSAASVAQAAGTAERPNIVLITADDMRQDDLKFMPRTRELLGAAGTTFTDAVSNYPLCCPARAMLLTGQYPHNNGVRGNQWPYGGHRTFYDSGTDKHTLPVWLRAAGYRTAFIGKYLNNYGAPAGDQYGGGPEYIPPGWDDWNGSYGPVYRYYCTRMNRNGKLMGFPGRYQTDLYTDLGREVIDASARTAKPFFLWVSHLAPHDGFTPGNDGPCSEAPGFSPAPAKRHVGMFDGLKLPPSPARNEADMSDKNSYVRDRAPRNIPAVTLQHHARLQALQALDESVGDTVAELRRKGVLDNTLFVFTSDNGWLLGEHRVNSKILPYEESLKVPLLVRGPGFPAGVRRGQPTGLIDITATAVQAGRARPTKPLDGVSLRDLARDPSYLRHRVMAVEAGPTKDLARRAVVPEWLYRGARSSRFSYVAWTPNGTVEEEFYDLAEDPYQLESTHDLQSKALRAMRALSLQLQNCAGASCIREYNPGGPRPRTPKRTGDTRGPVIEDVRAPRGWLTTARPRITYTASDPTNRRSSLLHWCSQHALGCDGSGKIRLRLAGEGTHHWTIFVADRAQNLASATGRVRVDLRRPQAWTKANRYVVAGRSRTGWHTTDTASGVASVDVRSRVATGTGGFSRWQYDRALQDRSSAPRVVRSPAGNSTVCWQVRAEDKVGRVSPWRGSLCRSRPMDASVIDAGQGWRTVRKGDWYAGTADVATQKGSTLEVPTGGRVALVRLVARTGPNQGMLRLTVGGQVLGRVDLSDYGQGRRAFAFEVAPMLSGTVRATVVSDGLPTWVDSLGVVRAPAGWPAG